MRLRVVGTQSQASSFGSWEKSHDYMISLEHRYLQQTKKAVIPDDGLYQISRSDELGLSISCPIRPVQAQRAAQGNGNTVFCPFNALTISKALGRNLMATSKEPIALLLSFMCDTCCDPVVGSRKPCGEFSNRLRCPLIAHTHTQILRLHTNVW